MKHDWNAMSVYDWIEFGTAILLGAAVEVGVALGPTFPCLGQWSTIVETSYYISYYLSSLFLTEDVLLYTTISIYMYELFNSMTINWCKNGLFWNPSDLANSTDEYISSTITTVDTALDLVVFGVDFYELIYLIENTYDYFNVGMFIGKITIDCVVLFWEIIALFF